MAIIIDIKKRLEERSKNKIETNNEKDAKLKEIFVGLTNEIRMFLAESLLYSIIFLCPNKTKDGLLLLKFIKDYGKEKTKDLDDPEWERE